MSSCRRVGWAVLASAILAPVVCAGPLPDDGGVVGMGREHPWGARGRRRRVHLRQGHPGRQPDHAGRRPGAVRPAFPPRRLLHAARHRLRPPALGGPARHRAAEPGRALHPEPDPGGREAGRRGERRGGGLRRRARVALAGAAQATLRPRDGRPRHRTAGNESAPALSLPAAPQLAALGPLAGSMEFAATAGSGSPADAAGSGLPGGVGSLRLQGQLADGVRWSLGGLIAESEGRAWRTAAEFVLEPGGGHEVEVGAGYGAGDQRPTLAGVAAGARPGGGGGVRPRPLAARRQAHRDDRRPLHLRRVPARFAPRRRGRADRAARRPADPRARVGRDPHPHAGRRPADAVHRGGLPGHHLGAARGGPAPGALAAVRGRRRPRSRAGPPRGAPLRRDDARRAAHDLRRQHAGRPQRRKRRGPGLRPDPRPPLRRRRERLRDLHLRPRPPLRVDAVPRGRCRSPRSTRRSSTTSWRASRR